MSIEIEFNPVSDAPRDIVEWARTQIEVLLEHLNNGMERVRFVELHVAPSKPRDGDVVFADGTNWDPGFGRGFYGFMSGDWFALSLEPTHSSLTIASGVLTITPTSTLVSVVTEASAATDDLDTINGGVSGQVVTFKDSSSNNEVTFKDGTGNLRLAGDFTATHADDMITMVFFAGTWREISRSDNTV